MKYNWSTIEQNADFMIIIGHIFHLSTVAIQSILCHKWQIKCVEINRAEWKNGLNIYICFVYNSLLLSRVRLCFSCVFSLVCTSRTLAFECFPSVTWGLCVCAFMFCLLCCVVSQFDIFSCAQRLGIMGLWIPVWRLFL